MIPHTHTYTDMVIVGLGNVIVTTRSKKKKKKEPYLLHSLQ